MLNAVNTLHTLLSILLQGALVAAAALQPGSEKQQSPATPDEPSASPASPSDILKYISTGWDTLTRAMDRCESLEDTKTGESILYLPADMEIPPSVAAMQKKCRVRVDHLPKKITGPGQIDPKTIPVEGLLYLEHPYVVPGGQFNEMYGWDSYFIIRGLLREGRTDLARGMVENFFFEIDHYGGVLNANRTYYLSRSQPPFLSSMILAVYDSRPPAGRADSAWLARAYEYAQRDYQQWTVAPHLAGDTGLSRYYDHADGPVPEIMSDPSHYYRGAAYFFLAHRQAFGSYLVEDGKDGKGDSEPWPQFPVYTCQPVAGDAGASDCVQTSRAGLSRDFYKGDRSMRESGFDVTFRFGPFGAATHHFAPVCLNSLLYKTEKDLQHMAEILGKPDEAKKWGQKADERRELMLKYFWDAGRGLFFDYNTVAHSRSHYEYASTFYPLWAGLASKEEAAGVARNLEIFEQPGGVAMSHTESEAQWDFPYGWAPVQLLAIEGLRRYGYTQDADRLSNKFLSMVLENFRRDRTIREKYNVVTRSSETNIVEGYSQNVTGFGWTNAVFLELLHGSPGSRAFLTKDPK